MAAPLALDMRLSAMEPEASTTKITRAPALRASRLARMSAFSTYTGLGASPLLSARSRRAFWNGAAVRIVASTASRFTSPLGIIGLM